jgi:hypothetical protein
MGSRNLLRAQHSRELRLAQAKLLQAGMNEPEASSRQVHTVHIVLVAGLRRGVKPNVLRNEKRADNSPPYETTVRRGVGGQVNYYYC